MAKTKYYAVAVGHQLGIFNSWCECEAQVKGFKGAKFKSFASKAEAENFVVANKIDTTKQSNPSLCKKSPLPKRRKIEPTRKILIGIHFDGGSRGNPGLSGAGSEVVVTEQTLSGHTLKQQKIHVRKYLGRATNNEAEYNGVLCGLLEAKNAISNISKGEHNWIAYIEVKGDSNLIIQQLSGTNECRSPNLVPLYHKANSTLSKIRSLLPLQVSFEHVYRKDNCVADGMYQHFFLLMVNTHLLQLTHTASLRTCK